MGLNQGEIVRVSARCKGPQGQDIVNVFHYRAAENIPMDDDQIVENISFQLSQIYGLIDQYMPATQQPYDIKVDVVQLVNGEEQIVRNLGVTGWQENYFEPSGTGNVYAPGVAVGVLLRTAIGKVFGRKFIGVLMEDALGDHGKLISGAISTFTQFAAALASAMEFFNYTLEPGVLSKRAGEFVKAIGYELATEAFYQRRRNVRRGS